MSISAVPPDIAVIGQHLGVARDLLTAVNISLLSWARAQPDDAVPSSSDLKGWWGDTYSERQGDSFGSRLWLLWNDSVTNAVDRAPQLAEDALAWLIEDGLLDDVTATAAPLAGRRDAIALFLVLSLPTGVVTPPLGPWTFRIG